jgi:glyoxylase-like metal-dependent hydrolase (beta-lactamase superfamily II)
VGGLRVQALETLGHASHHHAYLVEGVVFAGDIAGVRIAPGPFCPPRRPRTSTWKAGTPP